MEHDDQEPARLQASLEELLGAADVADAHGALCGRLCSGQALDLAQWWTRVRDETEERVPPALLAELLAVTQARLNDPALGFQPLLPADDAALGERVEALRQWCQGFLYGLGESGWSPGAAVPRDVQEALRDLTEISHAGVDPGDEDEQGERAYAELVEFVRVSVLLIHDHLSEPNNRRNQ